MRGAGSEGAYPVAEIQPGWPGPVPAIGTGNMLPGVVNGWSPTALRIAWQVCKRGGGATICAAGADRESGFDVLPQ